MSANQLNKLIASKSVLFISTKNSDYIRNTQEIELLNKNAQKVTVIASSRKSYPIRLLTVYFQAFKALLKKDFDILFIGFAPQLLFFIFPFFPKNKTIIMDFFISFFDTLVDDRKKFSEKSLAGKILHWLDKKTIHVADFVISDTKAHKKYFVDEFSYPEDQVIVLYIVADTSIYQPIFLDKHNDIFEVVYFGSILPVQGLSVILEAISQLRDQPNIHFTIIGPTIKKYNIKEKQYPNATFIEWLSQKELAHEISKADLALAGHFSSDIGKANRTIAGKTYIYKAMGKPVVLGDSEANRELFIEDDLHFFVKRGDAIALAELIEKRYYIYKERISSNKMPSVGDK